jgi:hypothetical protein
MNDATAKVIDKPPPQAVTDSMEITFRTNDNSLKVIAKSALHATAVPWVSTRHDLHHYSVGSHDDHDYLACFRPRAH